MKWNGIREECEGWRSITYGDLLKELVDKYKNKTAIISDEENITYRELDCMSDSLLAYLLEIGIKKGDTVILQVPNSIELPIILFALLKGGIVPVMTLPAHGEFEITSISRVADAKAYICMDTILHGGCEETAEKVAKKNPNIQYVLKGEKLMNEAHRGNILGAYGKPEYGDIAMLLLSGGTTGIPKLIPRTHGDYIYDNKVIGERCRLDEQDVFLAVLPVCHNFTLGNPGILGTLYYGGSVVISDAVSPVEIFELIEAHAVTYTAMVPTVLEMCLQYRKESKEEDISSLNFVMTGGAMLPKECEDSAVDVLDCVLLQIYGTAEGLNTCYSPDEKWQEGMGKQGPPISPYDEMLILDENDEPLPFGSKGALVTRGPYTITGYYNNPEANKISFTEDGYYRTGDLAVLNERNELTILGRVVEQINKGGEKIMPVELENCICEHDKVKDCAVLGIPDKELGSLTAAFIIPKEEKLNRDEINEFLKECGVARYKWPDEVINLESFPYTAVSKIDKNRIKEIYLEKQQ